jgi:spermidine synthase
MTRDWKSTDLRLFIDGHIQFSQTDEYRYHEALVHPVMSLGGQAETILIMGGGDGLALREILKYPAVKRIDLVDLDPDMTRIGKEFAPLVRLNRSSLSDPRVHIYNEDAFIFIRRKGIAYDRVILDFPDPHNEAISKLYSLEFYQMLSRRLSADAAIATQSSSPFFARRTFWTIEKTLAEIFPSTTSYQIAIPAFGVWGFNIARKAPASGTNRISVPTRFLDDRAFEAAKVFGKDISQPDDLTANSIFEPTLYQTYIQDLQGRTPALDELL